jgi:hypothetical protein
MENNTQCMRGSNDGPTRSAPSAHFPKPEEACAGDMRKKTKKKKPKTKTKGHQNSLDAWALMHSVIDDGKSTTSEALFAEQTGAQASTQHIILGTFIP